MKDIQTRVITDLATEPVTLAEAKNYCKVTGSQDNDLITLLITAARKALEKYTQSSFGHKHLTTTWVTVPENWTVELPHGPHNAVSAVYLIDEEGTEELLTANTDYYVLGDQDLRIQINQHWLSGGAINMPQVRVEYTAGYGDTTTETLPDELKLAVLKQIATDYMLRENIGPSGMSTLSNDAKSLAAPYRRKIWF